MWLIFIIYSLYLTVTNSFLLLEARRGTFSVLLQLSQNVTEEAVPMSSYDTSPTFSPLTSSGGVVGVHCTYEEGFKRVLLPVVYGVVFLLGLPLNAAVMLRLWRHRSPLRAGPRRSAQAGRHPLRAMSGGNVYTLNLAVADLLYVSSLPLLIYNYASNDYWPFGELACKLVRFQFYSNLHCSIIFLTCISLQRYAGICHPLASWQRSAGRRRAWLVCGGAWLLVGALCAPTLHFAATGTKRNRTVCYELSAPERSGDYYPYGMALTALGFLLPFSAITLCYCRMARTLCRPAVAAAAAEQRAAAVRTIVVVAAVFWLSFLPFHLTKTLYLAVRALPATPCATLNLLSVVYKCTRPFASANAVLDPLLFYFTLPRRRRRTLRILRRAFRGKASTRA